MKPQKSKPRRRARLRIIVLEGIMTPQAFVTAMQGVQKALSAPRKRMARRGVR